MMRAPMELTAWQWTVLALGAFVTGLSKTGIAGLGVLSVALFANALPPRESTGALLPLLVCADVFGVAFFRKHASWPHLWKLFLWVVVGVHVWRQQRGPEKTASLPHSWWFASLTGFLAGFTTMVANAAGPVML